MSTDQPESAPDTNTTPPATPKPLTSTSSPVGKSGRKSLRDSLLVSLQQQKGLASMHGLKDSIESVSNGTDGAQDDAATGSNRSSFPMIPSLRNSLRSSNSSIKKKNFLTKDLMEIYDLISVKDFGYPSSNPLHYGLSNYELYLNNESSDYFNTVNDYGAFNDHFTQTSSTPVPESEPYEKLPEKGVTTAIALFDFEAENDNELELRESQEIIILYRHGQGWLVGKDPVTNNTGLIPEEYVQSLYNEEDYGEYDESGETIQTEAATAAELKHNSGKVQPQDKVSQGQPPVQTEVESSNDVVAQEQTKDESQTPLEKKKVFAQTLDLQSDDENEAFYNATSQITSPVEEVSNTPMNTQISNQNEINKLEARTTQITEFPIRNFAEKYSSKIINEANSTPGSDGLKRGKRKNDEIENEAENEDENGKAIDDDKSRADIDELVMNRNRSESIERSDQVGARVTSNNYLRFLEHSSTVTTPNIDRSAGDSSGSEKFSNELESETSDLQIDNAELKPYLPEIFRVNSLTSNSVSNNADSPLSLTNSVSFSRFPKAVGTNNSILLNSNTLKRKNSGYSSGSSIFNGYSGNKSGIHNSSSLNSNLNLNLTFGNGSSTTALLTGTAVNRRGSLLFGNGLIQSKSTNSINFKMSSANGGYTMPRSTSLTKPFVGSVIANDEFEDMRFKPPNLLSKDNYFNGFTNDTTVTTVASTTTRSNSNTNSNSNEDFWIDDEILNIEKRVEKATASKKLDGNEDSFETDEPDLSKESNGSIADISKDLVSVSTDNGFGGKITPVTSTPVTSQPNEVSNTSILPKSITMRSISGHHRRHKSTSSHEGDKNRVYTFTRALGRKLSKIRLK